MKLLFKVFAATTIIMVTALFLVIKIMDIYHRKYLFLIKMFLLFLAL